MRCLNIIILLEIGYNHKKYNFIIVNVLTINKNYFLKICYDRNGLGDGTSGGGKVEVVGPLNVVGVVDWVANGGCGIKPNGFAIPKIILIKP